MLPKIISNITLAFIAIVVLYTLAPLFKDILDSIFNSNRPKKKSHSKEEFDEMVKRKIERMSMSGGAQGVKGQSGQGPKERSFLSYFKEKDLFSSPEDEQFFEGMNSSMQWGDFQEAKKILNQIENDFEIIDKSASEGINQFIKSIYNKETLLSLKKLNGGKIDKQSFLSLASTLFVFRHINQIKSKRFADQNQLLLILNLAAIKDTKAKIKLIESYINAEAIDSIKESPILYRDLISGLNKTFDQLYPLLPLKTEKLEKEFNNLSESDRKKKYKKLVQIYHPDKWHGDLKSQAIDDRLRENFNLIQKLYK